MDKLKPHQLLELGSTQVKHVRGHMFDCTLNRVMSACAIGMIRVGMAGSTLNSEINQTDEDVSKLLNVIVDSPKGKTQLSSLVIWWNDDRKLSVAEIVEKLKSIGQ